MKGASISMRSVAYDIVLLPAEEQARKAIALSRTLESRHTFFTLDDQHFYAHVSLFMVQLKLDDIKEVKQRLAASARTVRPLDLTALRYNQSWGYIDVEYKRSSAATELQAAVLSVINPLRDGITKENAEYLSKATGIKRENLATYGYKSVGELFRPHLTLTRFTSQRPIDTTSLPDVGELSGTYSQIGLFELGDHGTCVREVVRFDLGGRSVRV